MHFAPLGDHAITISLGESIDERTHRLVRAVSALLDARPPQGLIDQVPAFVSVAVHYDPAMVPGDTSASPYQRMVSLLEHALRGVRPDELEPARVIDIPVCYGGAFGPDLDDVAQQHDLRAGEVVEIHAGCEYLVYMVGFMPGFAYLGGLSDRIATPRRASPRALVPGGTVGIGGQQTGVYPLESPGGWNLIGRTPLRIFDISRDQAALLATGDRVRFRPITPAEFESNPGTS
jgi:inhibitor of KinA